MAIVEIWGYRKTARGLPPREANYNAPYNESLTSAVDKIKNR